MVKTSARLGLACLLLLLGISGAVLALRYAARPPGQLSDFSGIWSWSRFVALEGTVSLYDPATLHRFQQALDPSYGDLFYPFLYPPTYLLYIWPLGLMDQGAARLVWSAVSVAIFVFGVFGTRWRVGLLLTLAAPATALTLICGQNGLITAGLMLGALRTAASQPVLAGMLLGLLGYKPQFAILMPVAFLAAGRWRVLFSAAATTLLLAVMSSTVFGGALWPSWWVARSAHWDTILAFIADHESLVPTVSAFLHALNVGPTMTTVAQLATGVIAAAAVWMQWRRAPDTPRAIAMVPIATLLATPYAFLYDLPIVSGGILALLAGYFAGGVCTTLELTIYLAGLLLPLLMFQAQGGSLPIAAPVLAILLAVLARRQIEDDDHGLKLQEGPLNRPPTTRAALLEQPACPPAR